jgi:PTH1 family peptidyl-tRNA hydrolase
MGALVLDALMAAHHTSLQRYLPTAEYGEAIIGAHHIVFAKPLTYMNNSGKAVAALCAHFLIPANDLIVIHDDLDLALGRIKVKSKGGDAGHYGVRSIIEHLGTGEFTRIRVGIGRPTSKDEVVAFVLSPFTPDELPLVYEAIRQAVARIDAMLQVA